MITPAETIFEAVSSSVENMGECLSAIAPFSVCDLVCENKCTAIDNLNQPNEDRCKAKICEFLNKNITAEDN